MAEIQSQDIRDYLSRFATGPLAKDRDEALTELLRTKQLSTAARGEEFRTGVRGLLRSIEHAEGEERLVAIAALIRAAAFVKSQNKQLPSVLPAAMKRPIASLQQLPDADARFYVARALSIIREPWVLPFAAREIVLEDSGEKARAELARTLLTQAQDLREVFQLIAVTLGEWAPQTTDVEESRARRLRRLIAAIRPLMVELQPIAGSDPGSEAATLIRQAIVSPQGPQSKQTRVETAMEVIRLVLDLIRVRFSLATEPSTYEPLQVARSWFLPSTWPDELNTELRRVADVVMEAITLLAKQGLVDDRLFEALVLVTDRAAAVSLTSRLAKANPGLSVEVRTWLSKGPGKYRTRAMKSADESLQLELDPAIARLLLAEMDLRKLERSIAEEIVQTLALHAPALEVDATKLFGLVRTVLQEIRIVVGKRGLRARGTVGSIAPYTPLEHDLAGNRPGVARSVRIRVPLVERERADLPSQIVLKAIVEPMIE